MRTFHIVPKPEGGSCDFCTAQPIQEICGCRNFVWQQRNIFSGGSMGFWTACRECAELVDSERWSGLTERSLRQFLINHTIAAYDEAILREQFREIHKLFRQHRISGSHTFGLEAKPS